MRNVYGLQICCSVQWQCRPMWPKMSDDSGFPNLTYQYMTGLRQHNTETNIYIYPYPGFDLKP